MKNVAFLLLIVAGVSAGIGGLFLRDAFALVFAGLCLVSAGLFRPSN